MKKNIIISVSIIICIIASYIAYTYCYDRYISNFKKDVKIYVYPNTTIDDIKNEFYASSAIKSKSSIKRVFKNGSPKIGYYIIKKGTTSKYAYSTLINGWQTPKNLVLAGKIRTKARLAKVISNQLFLDSSDIHNKLNDSIYLKQFDCTPENVFYYFIPDTYQVYWTTSLGDIINRQKQEHKKYWNQNRLKQCDSLGLTPYQVSILASIVNGETNYEPEMPIIASVYLNRLNKGMKLQADPTIAYCYNYTINRILRKHLKFDSPFNTYLYYGLPPAPICIPTKSALEAVLNPQKSKYLYFCASPQLDGTHRFAISYKEHLKNASQFYKAVLQRNNEAQNAK